MVAVPGAGAKVATATLDAVLKAREQSARAAGHSFGLAPSSLAAECRRQLWYKFRWVEPPTSFSGQMLRLFETGEMEEGRIVSDLRRAGFEVWDFDQNGRQFKARMVGGHVRGKLDGVIKGLPEAPNKAHVLECKSHNEKSFKKLLQVGVKNSKPEHYGQMQLYMKAYGLDRALYAAVCKNNDELYFERVDADLHYQSMLLAKAEATINDQSPPAKLHPDPTAKSAFACGWCDFKQVCHERKMPTERNCRTCLNATPLIVSDDAAWHCSKWNKPLTFEEQKTGCDEHLFIPDLVPGRIESVDEENALILYVLDDGTKWVDGQANVLPQESSDDAPF